MPIESVQGSLTMVDLNTQSPKLYWNGRQISGVVGVRVNWESDEQKIVIRVQEQQDLAEMTAAGIIVKREI